eukprot:CAMPEP_0196140176 /NCGR_PEP_ID=MMETSP0910-20130528/7177_1 /TAXON_ID=49265 /ORGANISM="Thalassiosira rotula, Strain GSO102" /LENGTH=126 /DNA_ID=CAMNT_0041400999 /DNA_START=113 /DNA_END=493 /DNA_ORIENTATION=+
MKFFENKQARLEAALGPPSKTMDASEYAQELVMIVSRTIESHLNLLPVPGKRRDFKATQMITRSVDGSSKGAGENGTMYYIKVKTPVEKWPWIFVKVHEPPLVTGVSRVKFEAMKKMDQEYKLVTF